MLPENPNPQKRYYWDTPLAGSFDLEAVQAQIKEMTDEEVARVVLAIRLAPAGHSQGGGGEHREKSPAVKAAEKTKRLTQREMIAAAKEYLLQQQMSLSQVAIPTPQEEWEGMQAEIATEGEVAPDEQSPLHYYTTEGVDEP